MGHFVYAARAFDILDRTDSTQEYWDAKRGACIGIFQQLIQQHHQLVATVSDAASSAHSSAVGSVKPSDLQESLSSIRNTSNPQVEYITRIIKKWCKDNGVKMN